MALTLEVAVVAAAVAVLEGAIFADSATGALGPLQFKPRRAKILAAPITEDGSLSIGGLMTGEESEV